MATTIWSNKELYHWGNTGYIKMDVTYTYSRDGADMLYTVNVTVKQTGSQAYFNDSVGCQIKLNGTEVYKNTSLKGSTSSSTTSWSKTAKVSNSRVSNKTSGTTSLSVRVWDSQGYADFDKTNTANLTVLPAMPVLTVGTPSAAINYANFTITDSTSQTMTNYEIANSSGTVVQDGTLSSSSATIKFSGISGTRLSANTTYSGYKIRAKNAIGWGDYVTIPDFKTLDIPTASTSGNFDIGSNTTINISTNANISSWSVTASDGTSTKSGTGSGTSYTVAVSDSTYVTNMLNNHSSTTSWTMTYTVSFNSDGAYVGSRTVTNICSIPSGSYNPTFASSRVSYADINQTTKTITGSDAKIIKGYSNVKFSVNTMTPATGATASKYKVTANGTTQEATHTGNMLYFTFNNVSSNGYSAQAIDSRGKSTTVSGTYSTFIQYVQPAFTSNSTKRTDSGIGMNININATASYYVWSGLSQNNTITSVQYKVGSSGTLQTIPASGYTASNGTVSINYTTTGNSFVQANAYTVYIYVTDRLATRETSVAIPSAQPLLWKDRANKRLGIKKKPDYTLDVDGDIRTNGYLRTAYINASNNITCSANLNVTGHLQANYIQTISLTWGGADNSVAGYRLIATFSTPASWTNHRIVMAVASRHTGDGIVSVACGNNSSTSNNNYGMISYFGTYNSGSVISNDSFQLYKNNDGTEMYLYWKYSDYNDTKITVLSTTGPKLNNGTWTTSISGTRVCQTRVNIANSVNLDSIYPVGSVYVANTSSFNPNTTFGGSWTLFDKEFEPKSSTDNTGFTRNTTNCTAVTAFHWFRYGHTITLTVIFTNKVAIADTTLPMFTFDFATLGITQFATGHYGVTYSDGGEAVAFININATSGAFQTVDAQPANIAAGQTDNRGTFNFVIPPEYMLDSACSKFYWKRTA